VLYRPARAQAALGEAYARGAREQAATSRARRRAESRLQQERVTLAVAAAARQQALEEQGADQDELASLYDTQGQLLLLPEVDDGDAALLTLDEGEAGGDGELGVEGLGPGGSSLEALRRAAGQVDELSDAEDELYVNNNTGALAAPHPFTCHDRRWATSHGIAVCCLAVRPTTHRWL
jgi:hypothetical protein